MKNLLFIALIFLVSCEKNEPSVNIKPSHVYSIGFGSCLTQEKPMPIFNAIKSENYDLFLMLGDNVYGDTDSNDLIELRDAYEKQRENFDRLNLNFPFEAIWDDHDYGKNDGGKEYIYKEEAEQIFLDFWNIPQDDIRRNRPGLYFEKTQEIDGISIQMIFLDTRFFRDALLPTDEKGAPGKERYIPHTDTSLTMLGEGQWTWLQEQLDKEVDHKIIVTSIQFLAMGHGWEAWKTLPHERQRLIDLVDQSSSEVLFISGDRHRGGLYQFSTQSGKVISEMTSSSLNLAFANDEEDGPLRSGPTFVQENYGEILLDKLTNTLIVNLKDNQGKIIQSLSL
ncbi:MAG: alkaline phosphatase D family protein [Candidatus Marinimicrobia bacterium]|nr:alkaline phosphatase D family protein [Candidatus Neomarinimicrobiota bacterium]